MRTAIVWGVEASPFLLKLEAMLRFHERPFRRLPRDGEWLENVTSSLWLARAKRNRRIQRYPEMDRALDEYPSVPFFSEDGRNFQYDSSALGRWSDARSASEHPPLFPVEPGPGFVAQLIDEAFDEFGLYLVHHMRWVGSARDTTMGERTARELSRLVSPMFEPGLRRRLPRRQVRRCPYLFSVAPEDYRADVEKERVPPSRAGFPATHDLLHESWCAYLAAMESLLSTQPWILGERFTIADASAYGQLSMNLIDPSVARDLKSRAPRTFAWLEGIREGRHVGSRGTIYLSEALQPLLEVIMETFAPLMVQNKRAWIAATARGEQVFNEAAFDQGRALYRGELRGHPFRAVIKTFQVRVWTELCDTWAGLSENERSALPDVLARSAILRVDPNSI